MSNIQVIFQAYIPRNLGRTMVSYFQSDWRFNLLVNKDEFIRKLRDCDRGFTTWLPEPVNTTPSHYFATDDADSHHYSHSSHSSRLRIEMVIDTQKIGFYNFPSEIFRHEPHSGWPGNTYQHSNYSQRVKAYIKKIPFYTDFPRPSSKDVYFGVCEKDDLMRAEEKQIKATVHSTKNGGLNRKNQITIIKTDWVSASYPYLEWVAPNIDFKLKATIIKSAEGTISIEFDGTHNLFPAYELIINNKVIYYHKPIGSGPDFGNLNESTNFSKIVRVYLKIDK